MKFYHGTSKENWNKILNEGILWGYNIHKNSDGNKKYLVILKNYPIFVKELKTTKN